ncbi:hypothetical protein A4H97_24100 [Niastella yeongjuensis]|uniref:IPT/TIG domain-containing protein n=1 Tax=Niastella yeongjuensis TaxID=354355 RepID=A0A1V9F3E0_9BACT|nr:IPT/TIG domain-containing protein [Niastella yeongjuensis]OQP52787.1 hypothetical protein A4H97_24100 [Niastella yeongjuensis]SEP19763.1 IPT/TIG domain-containing protein [Niastella yeongjuensis]
MKQKLFVLIALFSLTLVFSCSKSDGPNFEDQLPGITSISPEKIYTGTQVTINGKNFSNDTAAITLWIDNQIIPVSAATTSSVTFTIPLHFLTTGQKACSVQLDVKQQNVIYSAHDSITISYQEPHGWFYTTTLPVPGDYPVYKQLIFPTDSIGYVRSDITLYMTTDGGITWKGDINNGGFSHGSAVASSDGKNVWLESIADVLVGTNGINTWTIPAGTHYNSLIAGLYTTDPANGLVALACGKLYDINGSFSGATIKYQSPFYVNDNTGVWQKMSAIDKDNLILTGRYNKFVIEKAGVFSEGDLSSLSGTNVITTGLQMVDANTIFLVNSNDELIKYSGNTWTKLSQKANAVYFINTTTGYIAYNDKILKTTDGGASWAELFTLKASEKAGVICARNGKIWVIGNGDKQSFVLKYNP